MVTRRNLLAALTVAAAGVGLAGRAGAQSAAKNKVVFQVSDADPKRWALAMNNIANVQDAMGRNNVAVELVVYGPGIGLLKFDSELSGRIDDAIDRGVKVVACENTMKAQKLTRNDMHPKIGYVPAGVVELVEKQQQGWAYIRP